MSLSCPVCAAVDAACGHTELDFPPITLRGTRPMAETEGTIYLPRQHVKRGRGVPGYRGKNIKVVSDPSAARAADEKKAAKKADDKA